MEAPKMIESINVDAISTFAQNANLVATSADDFGGYSYPIAGLIILGAVILLLSPPLAEIDE